MKSPFLSLTNGGILAVILGLVFVGLSSHQSGQNDEFLERGLLREGRVVSHKDPGQTSDYILRLKTNVSPVVTGTDMRIIEIEVKEGDYEKAPVGSLLQVVLIPDDPPRARLAGATKRATYQFSFVFASLFITLGLFLLWLTWHHKKTLINPSPSVEKSKKIQKNPEAPNHSSTMEKQLIKDPILYDGPFQFSYSAEKTSIELKSGTSIRVSQYRPITDLPKVLTDKDLLHILRTAQSNWKPLEANNSGKVTLSQLLKEKRATEADQFFINGPYLGLLYRDEINNGHWHSAVRGIWKITPLSRIFANLVSSDPDLARQAAFDILNHQDLGLIASLAPDLPTIRAALNAPHRSGNPADSCCFITRAADVIDSLANGNCYCQAYTKTPDSPHLLLKKGKFTLKDPEKEEKESQIICSHCQKEYTITEHAGHYAWEEKKQTSPPLTELGS